MHELKSYGQFTKGKLSRIHELPESLISSRVTKVFREERQGLTKWTSELSSDPVFNLFSQTCQINSILNLLLILYSLDQKIDKDFPEKDKDFSNKDK